MLGVVSIPHSTWSLEGEKRLSIFISPLDLFWAVIKVQLPLRISIMISLTLVHMRPIDCQGLPAHLLLNLPSCEFTQRHVWLMKVRIRCNNADCFTTSQCTASLWWGGMDSQEWAKNALRCYREQLSLKSRCVLDHSIAPQWAYCIHGHASRLTCRPLTRCRLALCLPWKKRCRALVFFSF